MAKGDRDSYLPHIILGDFNQQPESPGYRILQCGVLPDDARDELERQKHIEQVEAATEGAKEHFNGDAEKSKTGLIHLIGADLFTHSSPSLKSAYFEALKGREPPVTCVDLEQDNKKQTLDYIWFSGDTLQLESVVDVPSEAQIDAEVAFPSQTFPSDHISLSATFKFK